jgi:hypothetical protein
MSEIETVVFCQILAGGCDLSDISSRALTALTNIYVNCFWQLLLFARSQIYILYFIGPMIYNIIMRHILYPALWEDDWIYEMKINVNVNVNIALKF